MKFTVSGRDTEAVRMVLEKIKSQGSEVVKSGADMVITCGGDGSFLYAERTYPGIPKLLLRSNSICVKCDRYSVENFEIIMDMLLKGMYKVRKYHKIEAVFQDEGKDVRLLAANDIVVRNKEPYKAIRFSIMGREEVYIGDGAVFSTCFGSTGYFYSITKQSFDEDRIGIAFNNLTIEKSHEIVDGADMRIVRGPAVVCHDDDRTVYTLDDEAVLQIRQSDEVFQLVELGGDIHE